MPAEGMVDALRRASALVAADGVLIDLHPTPDDAQLHVVRGAVAQPIGPLRSRDATERHANADAAIATAIAEGVLVRDAGAQFVFSRYSSSLDELVDHVHSKWSARFDDALLTKARRALRGGGALRLSEKVSIAALRPLVHRA